MKKWGIVEKETGYQFYPHRVKGEGFFIAVFEKKEGRTFSQKKKKSKGFKNLIPVSKKEKEALTNWIDQSEQFLSLIHI